MEFILTRTYYPNGTNGEIQLKTGLVPLCRTIELPWKGNKRRISCIPEGRYQVQRRFSRKFKQHMILENVKDRSLILIHPANNALKELNGCIAPVVKHTGEGKGTDSRKAFEFIKEIMELGLDIEPVYLTIKSTNHDVQTKSTGAYTGVLQKVT